MSRILGWDKSGWEDYLHWQSTDKKILKRINILIKASVRDATHGIGKPEKLRNQLAGCYSRRINDEHRLVYRVTKEMIIIVSCRYHYSK